MLSPGRSGLLGILSFFACVVTTESGSNKIQCVQFGIGPRNYEFAYGNNGFNSRNGMWTIATKPMDAQWLAVLQAVFHYSQNQNKYVKNDYDFLFKKSNDPSCPWPFALCKNRDPDWVACVTLQHIKECVKNTELRMSMHLVKQNGRVLQGWVHVEIELLDMSHEEIELVYIQMRDEKFNAIGEFVTHDIVPGASCEPSKVYLSAPTQYQFYPCLATGLREPKTSQAVMMAKKEFYFKEKELEGKKYLHAKPIKKGVHFLWRISEYWCSRHVKFQPIAYILTKKNRLLFKKDATIGSKGQLWRKVSKYWVHPKWFGAADIILPHGKLDCGELIMDDDSGKLTSTAMSTWIHKTSLPTFEENDLDPTKVNSVCTVKPFWKASDLLTPTYSGRCNNIISPNISREHFQGCDTNPNSTEFEAIPNAASFVDYHEYTKKKQTEMAEQYCDAKCIKPTSAEHFEQMTGYKSRNDSALEETTSTTPMPVRKKDTRSRSRVVKLTSGRKYHGITFSFVAFFVAPVSIFYARNYKETFMSSRCYGVHIWYWMHIGGILATSCLFLSGHAALSSFYTIWGRAIDDASTLHRNLGYTSFAIFGFLAIFGGLRVREPGFGRIFTMMLHAVLGFAHHWLNLACVVLSTWMPMSPTLGDCDQSGMPVGFSEVFWLAVIWIFVDFVFHLILSILHIARDRSIGMWRSWYCPIVPIVQNDQMPDMAGAPLRKILLYVYIALALLVSILVSYFIMTNTTPTHCKYGETTCKHFFGCTKLAIKYEKWYLNQGLELPEQ